MAHSPASLASSTQLSFVLIFFPHSCLYITSIYLLCLDEAATFCLDVPPEKGEGGHVPTHSPSPCRPDTSQHIRMRSPLCSSPDCVTSRAAHRATYQAANQRKRCSSTLASSHEQIERRLTQGIIRNLAQTIELQPHGNTKNAGQNQRRKRNEKTAAAENRSERPRSARLGPLP